MTRPTSVSASRTAADGSSTNRAWTARHSSLKRRRSSAARGLISSFDTRFWRSVSSSSALRVSPFSATVRSYSGPNFSWSFALRCRIEYHHTAATRIAMITTATMISVASGMLDLLLRLPPGESNRASRPPPPQGMACSKEASHSRYRPGARPLGTAGGTSSGWGELQGPLFARDDDGVVSLLVDRAGRGTRCRTDRASDDGPDGPADDSADDRAPGLLVTVRGARHVVLAERFAMLGAVLRDGLALDDAVLCHGRVSCPGCAPVNAAREPECAGRARRSHEGSSSRRAARPGRPRAAARLVLSGSGSNGGSAPCGRLLRVNERADPRLSRRVRREVDNLSLIHI